MQGQLVGVALSFLRNFGILSGASGVLGALSSGVASAALDDRFAVQRAQQKQVGQCICISTLPTYHNTYIDLTCYHWTLPVIAYFLASVTCEAKLALQCLVY